MRRQSAVRHRAGAGSGRRRGTRAQRWAGRHPQCVAATDLAPDFILRRLSLFPVETLHLPSASPSAPPSVAELAFMTGKSTTTLVPELAGVVDAGSGEAGDRLAFRHDLVREAIYHDLPLAVRKGLHRQAASTLDGVSAPVERVASRVRSGPRRGIRPPWSGCTGGADHRRAGAHRCRPAIGRALAVADVEHARRVGSPADLAVGGPGADRGREALGRGCTGPATSPGDRYHGTPRSVLSPGVDRPLSRGDRPHRTGSDAASGRSSRRGRHRVAADGAAGRPHSGSRGGATIEDGERLGNEHAVYQGLQALAMATLVDRKRR